MSEMSTRSSPQERGIYTQKKILTGPQSGTLSVCPKYILVKSSLLFRLADLDLEQTEPEPFITSFIDIIA